VVVVPAAGPVYAAAVTVAVPALLVAYRSFARRGGDERAVRAFFTSNAVLMALFVGWALSGVAEGPVAVGASAVVAVAAVAGVWRGRPSFDGVDAAPLPGIDADHDRGPIARVVAVAGWVGGLAPGR
jgi:hypothetical protein